MSYRIELPPKWIDGEALDAVLATDIGPHLSMESSIVVAVPAGTSVMVDAGVRLLSLSNQLQHIGKRVTLDFSHEDTSCFEYLNRIGFFDELDNQIVVKPDRPRHSAAERFHGTNSGLVEIERLVPGQIDRDIPRRLEMALTSSIKDGQRQKLVGDAAYALFGELIDNVEMHSKSQIAGYAVLQVYKNGNGVRIAVSDSGQGLLEKLRKSVEEHYPNLERLNSRDLIMRALLGGGISSRGRGHGGAGLKVCADRAQSLQANLEIRTPNHSLRVRGKHRTWRPNSALTSANLPLIWGTHVVFDIRLD